MCGIVSAVAKNNVVPVLLEGLLRLEYRGYDSAGLVITNNGLQRLRTTGRVAELKKKAVEENSGTKKRVLGKCKRGRRIRRTQSGVGKSRSRCRFYGIG